MRTFTVVGLVAASLLLGASLHSLTAAAQSPQIQKKAWMPAPAPSPPVNVGPTLPPEPAPAPTDALQPDAAQADPLLLLGRIRDLEARLAKAEKQLAVLANHTHDASGPYFDTTVTYDQLLKSPEQYRAARVSLNFGNKIAQTAATSGPKAKQP